MVSWNTEDRWAELWMPWRNSAQPFKKKIIIKRKDQLLSRSRLSWCHSVWEGWGCGCSPGTARVYLGVWRSCPCALGTLQGQTPFSQPLKQRQGQLRSLILPTSFSWNCGPKRWGSTCLWGQGGKKGVWARSWSIPPWVHVVHDHICSVLLISSFYPALINTYQFEGKRERTRNSSGRKGPPGFQPISFQMERAACRNKCLQSFVL